MCRPGPDGRLACSVRCRMRAESREMVPMARCPMIESARIFLWATVQNLRTCFFVAGAT